LHDIDRALSDIADIRARVAASAHFRGFAPQAVAATGLIALATAAAQSLWPDFLATDNLRFVSVWAGAAFLAIAVVASEALTRTPRLHGPMANAMIGSTLRLFVPFAAAGAIITFIICSVSPANAWVLPGLWQMLVALAGFAAIGSLPRQIVWAAGWYLACGTAVLTLGAQSGALSPWMMGAPFAVGQSLVALILHFGGDADAGR
jgi:hypothetical protein